jgi:hypothetical protein
MSRSKPSLLVVTVLIVILLSLSACRGANARTPPATGTAAPSAGAPGKPSVDVTVTTEIADSASATTPTAPTETESVTSSPTARPKAAPVSIPQGLRAGLRSSPYGIDPFPNPAWWVSSINSMSGRFPGSVPATIWTVCEVTRSGTADCHFPAPADRQSYSDIKFSNTAEADPYLTAFDKEGIKVWLQVEPGNADMLTLIDLVMKQYAQHPSVIGFGVDVEWYQSRANKNGQAVTDAEAQAWVERVRTYGDYLVFLKHWLPDKMPSTYRDHLVFIDDSEKLKSLDNLVREFSQWGQRFAPSPVGFQYGYESDQRWWSELADPPKEIGDAILAGAPNTSDLYWVDFTAYDIWPQS